MTSVFIFDPTENDPLSKVRGVGRYLQILKENFPDWVFTSDLTPLRSSSYEGQAMKQLNNEAIFINPFFNFLQPPLTLNRLAKKQVAIIHDLIPLKYPKHFPSGLRGKLNIFLNKIALKNYDLIVTDSEASKKDIIDILYIDEDKIKVIYPCLPKAFEVGGLRLEEEKIYTSNIQLPTSFCLYVGDATWNKNLVNLAKAIKIINVTCVFVGRVFSNQLSVLGKKTDNRLPTTDNYSHPWQKEFREFLKEVDDDKRFIFLGYISDEQLVQLYQQARCNTLVSKDEGFGFSFLEAASQGCPSILSDIQVLHETSNNKGALFANPQNPIDIANVVGEVYFNKDLRNKLGFDAQKRVIHFNKNNFANSFLKIINS